MVGEALEFFTEFLYGSGSWFAVLFFIVIVVICVSQVKNSSLLFFPILALFGLTYINYVPNTETLTWCAIVLWVCIPITFFIDYKGD